MSLLHTDWPTAPLGRLASINERALAETTDPDYTFRYLDISSVGRGEIVEELATIRFENAPSRARRILRRGDTIVSTVRTYLRAVLPIRDKASDLIASTGFAVLSPGADIDSRFLSWYAQSDPFIEEVVARSVGVSYPAIAPSELAQFPVPTPALAEQRAIADFLDAETARIDALIAKKRRMIDLMNEKLTISISKALSNWPRVPLKRMVLYREGPGIMAEDFRDEGVPLLRVAGIGGTFATLDGCNFLDPQAVAKRWSRFAVEEGDYLISASASMGTVSRVGSDAAGAIPYTGIIRLRPATSDIDMEYARFFFRSENFMQQIDSMKTGVAIQHYGPTHLDQITLPVPPLKHQQRIAHTLSAEEQLAAALSQRLRQQIELLGERRQALITAAVTGQLSIPGVAA